MDFGDESSHARFLDLWPVGKIPVLRDHARERTIPETSIIIEYLDNHHSGARPLIPCDASALDARLWDRFFDTYVSVPMQKIVLDRIRPEEKGDPHGVAKARATLDIAYAMIERQLAAKTWAVGEQFTIADCAAAPALFFAHIVQPFSAVHTHTAAYFERLVSRASVKRTLAEAKPYFQYFPYRERIPARFFD